MEPKVIIIIAIIAVLIVIMSGRKVKYYCMNCGKVWKGIKHHSNTAPRCPYCKSSNIGRK